MNKKINFFGAMYLMEGDLSLSVEYIKFFIKKYILEDFYSCIPIYPKDKIYSKQEIEVVLNQLQLNQSQGSPVIYLLYESHCIRTLTIPLLLKQLESLNNQIALILITPYLYLLPDTIRSRGIFLKGEKNVSLFRDAAFKLVNNNYSLHLIDSIFNQIDLNEKNVSVFLGYVQEAIHINIDFAASIQNKKQWISLSQYIVNISIDSQILIVNIPYVLRYIYAASKLIVTN